LNLRHANVFIEWF